MQEKLSTIYQRIDKVLIDKGLVKPNGKPNYAKAERMCGIKGTVLSKTVKRKGTLGDQNKEKFLRTFHVEPRWFETGEGEIYVKNITPVPNEAAIPESPLRVEGDLVIPRSVFHDRYEIVPKALLDFLLERNKEMAAELFRLQQGAEVKKTKKNM